jgi:hypothetical protein
MARVDDVTIDRSRAGVTCLTTNISSGQGRIILEAKLNNYASKRPP